MGPADAQTLTRSCRWWKPSSTSAATSSRSCHSLASRYRTGTSWSRRVSVDTVITFVRSVEVRQNVSLKRTTLLSAVNTTASRLPPTFYEHQEHAQDAAHLSDIRYKGGATSYLEVLTNQTNYFSAELNLAQARLNELLSLVQLYKALGGGWEQ